MSWGLHKNKTYVKPFYGIAFLTMARMSSSFLNRDLPVTASCLYMSDARRSRTVELCRRLLSFVFGVGLARLDGLALVALAALLVPGWFEATTD